jgi:hypothetical protein
MLMTLRGREVVRQGESQAALEPGSVVVWDSETPAEFLVREPLVKRSLLVPKAALAEVGARGELMTGSVLDATAPAVTLLSGYLDALSATIDQLPLGALPAARRLETRKLIDRAKGLLMTHRGLTEPEAFRWIQRTAMDRRKGSAAVAAQVIAEFDQSPVRTAS